MPRWSGISAAAAILILMESRGYQRPVSIRSLGTSSLHNHIDRDVSSKAPEREPIGHYVATFEDERIGFLRIMMEQKSG